MINYDVINVIRNDVITLQYLLGIPVLFIHIAVNQLITYVDSVNRVTLYTQCTHVVGISITKHPRKKLPSVHLTWGCFIRRIVSVIVHLQVASE